MNLELMSSETLRPFEEEFGAVAASLSKKISALSSRPPPPEAEAQELQFAAQADVERCKEILQQMNVAVRNLPHASKQESQKRIKLFESDLDNQTKALERAVVAAAQKVPAAAAAAAGGSSRRGASRREIKDERQRLLEAKQINDESNESLSNTRRVLDETTQRGADVSSVLSEQKQQILRSKQNMDDVNSTMGRARKLLQRMARRTVANKLITAMIIVVELAAIGVIMWRKGYFNKL